MGSSGGTLDTGSTTPSHSTPATTTVDALVTYGDTVGSSLTASSAKATSSGAVSGVTQMDVDNLRLDANTISSTNTNGHINLAPNGSGQITIPNGSMSAPAISLASAPSAAGIGNTPAGFGLIHSSTIYTDLRVNALALRGGTATPGLSTASPGLLPDFTDGDTGVGSAGSNQLSLIAGNVECVRVTSAGSVFGGGSNFKGFTTTAGAPSLTEYPANKDWGFHLNTGTGAVVLAYNLSGTIKTVALA